MAEEKKSFPMLPVSNWWKLREKFKQSIPGVVTDNYLATALDTKPKSARANILPYLRIIGLIDDEGKTLDLAKAWRDDDQYEDVCKKIREKLYPKELLDAVPNPNEDREAVERWFGNHTGSGKVAIRRMASFYILLFEADVSKKAGTSLKKSPKAKVDKIRKNQKNRYLDKEKAEKTESKSSPLSYMDAPGININLEIHISADATSDQIDKIFESMAKHIYKR